MNIPLAAEPRPLTLGQIMSLAWEVFTSHLLTLVLIVGVIQIPLALVSFMTDLFAVGLLPEDPDAITSEDVGGILAFAGIYMVLGIVGLTLTVLVTGALIRAIGDALAGDEVDFGRSYRVAVNRFWRLLGALLLEALVFALLALTLIGIVAVVFFAIRWIVVQQAVILENTRATRALGRSWEMVRGNWWRTLGIVLVILIVAGIVPSIGADIVTGVLAAPFDGTVLETPVALVNALLRAGAGILGTAFGMTGLTVLYYDLRAREAYRGRLA